MAFTLTLLGTDTQFSPNHVENAYDKAETLSYISTLINTESTDLSAEVTKVNNKDVAVIDGPTTLGEEVGDRITRGVLAVLSAISRGETHINIIAHSRGAVEAILVAHELERIQSLMQVPFLRSFNPDMLNSECPYTKTAMTVAHKTAFENLDWMLISKHIKNTKIAMLNIDPVPGGNFIGITHLTKLAWTDKRFYILPEIVKEYEQFIYENERSRCFKPIVPKCVSSETKFRVQSLPGHHGTGSGNLKDQRRGENPTNKSTEHVQELVIVSIINFLMNNGVTIKPRGPEQPGAPKDSDKPEISDPFAHLMAELFTNSSSLSLKDRFRTLYFSLYNKILENREAYAFYNNTSYNGLTKEQGILRLIKKIVDQRIVHYQGHNDTHLETIIPPVPGGHFLNYEHARIHVNKELGLQDSSKLSETINIAVSRLIQICKNAKRLQALKNSGGNLSQSLVGDKMAHTVNSKEGFELLSQGASAIIKEIQQSFLQNKLTDLVERGAVYKEVQEAFTQFKLLTQEEPQNELAASLLKLFKSDLKSTLSAKCDALKGQYQELANKLKEKLFLNELEANIQKIIDNLKEKSTGENATEDALFEQLQNFILKLKALQKKNPLASQVQEFLERELKALKEFTVSGDLAEESRELACFEISEAIDDNLSYLLPHIIQEAISSSQNLNNFRKTLPDFKALDSSLPYDQWEIELEEQRARVIYLTAQYISSHKIPLKNIQLIFGSDNEVLYKEVEGLAIGMMAPKPITLILKEKLAIIDELAFTTVEQANQIRLLTKVHEEQAELISNLKLDVKAQAEVIKNLNLDVKAKAEVIKNLDLDVKAQAEVIKNLDLDVKAKAEVIKNLDLDVKAKAELIKKLELDVTDKAKLIQSLSSEKDAQAKLIVLLTSKKDEQHQLVKELTSTKEAQEKLIAELYQTHAQLSQENKDLREKVAELNEQLAKLKDAQEKTATVDEDNELNLQIIIKTKLIPLTKDYLIHLSKEIKKTVQPDLDISDLSNVADQVKQIKNWPEDKSSEKLKEKFEAVSKLHGILEAKNKPSVKVEQFYNELKGIDATIQAHRSSDWKRFTLRALGILATGILPGLGLMIYSAITGNTPKIWQSSGQSFFGCAEEVKKELPDEFRPKIK